mgnify:CR=1 FL=1
MKHQEDPEKKESLKTVIQRSFFRLTAAVTITFTLVSAGLIDFTEYHLFIPHIEHDFEQMIQVHSKQPGIIKYYFNDSIFYRVNDANIHELPKYLQDLDVGSHEIFHDSQAFHVLVKTDPQFRYFFQVNQSDFENMEQLIITIIIFAMFLSWVVAKVAGRILSKKILDPIQLLSHQIKTIDNDNPSHFISDNFANDEVGQLAHLFDQYNQKITGFLKREQMFTNDISHELRTPLMIISSSSEILLSRYNQSSIERDHLLKIQAACLEMKELVSLFLSLARNNPKNETLLPVEQIIEKQFQQYLPIAQNKGLSLSFTIEEPSELNKISEQFLSIILKNTLENAIKYTQNGEIQILLKKNSLMIKDTGMGIPETIKNTVFEPFIRGQNNHRSGMGLGLSIVKRICEHKNWSIQMDSQEQRGTSICIGFNQ